MTHAFDTGASLAQRTLIRRGVVTLLGGLKLPTGYLVDVIPFAAVVRSYTDVDGITALIDAIAGRTPSIAVALGDGASQVTGIGGFQAKKELELFLYHASGHGRHLLSGRLEMDVAAAASNQAPPGLDVQMEHAEELVIGQYCGVDPAVAHIKQIRPDREEELHTDEPITIWLQTFRITVTREINEFRNATQLLESIAWRFAIDDDEVLPPDPPVDELSLDSLTELT